MEDSVSEAVSHVDQPSGLRSIKSFNNGNLLGVGVHKPHIVACDCPIAPKIGADI